MVRKMTGPDAISANALSREMGGSQTVLSRWLRLAGDQVPSYPPTEFSRSDERGQTTERLEP